MRALRPDDCAPDQTARKRLLHHPTRFQLPSPLLCRLVSVLTEWAILLWDVQAQEKEHAEFFLAYSESTRAVAFGRFQEERPTVAKYLLLAQCRRSH